MKKEDIEFLKELQQALLEGDHDHQASPRYWTIKDYRKVHGNSEYDNCETVYVYNNGDVVEFDTVDDLKESLRDDIEGYEADELSLDELEQLLDNPDTAFDELWEFATLHMPNKEYYQEFEMKEEGFLVPNTMFLTKEEAQKHLERNHYHYTSKAHTYAMTAWRSPQVERLMGILENTDWNTVQESE